MSALPFFRGCVAGSILAASLSFSSCRQTPAPVGNAPEPVAQPQVTRTVDPQARTLAMEKLMELLQAKAADWVAYRRRVQLVDPPYLKGTVILVDALLVWENGRNSTPTGDRSNYELPDDLRPTTLDEVGTVIIATRIEKRVGLYIGKIAPGAFKDTLGIEIVDRSIPAVIGRKSFVSADPPKVYDPNFHAEGDVNRQMWAYLRTLERRVDPCEAPTSPCRKAAQEY